MTFETGRPAAGFRAIGLAALTALARCHPAAAVEVPVPVALVLIEANEGRIKSAEWSVEFRQGTLTDPADPSTAVFGKVAHTGRVIYEAKTGRYRVNLDSVSRWVQGADDHIASRNFWAFDGRRCHEYLYMKAGTDLPRVPPGPLDDHGSGRMFAAGVRPQEFDMYEGVTGVADFPPKFQRRRLSASIRERPKDSAPVTVHEERGLWTVALPGKEGEDTQWVDYDPDKGCVVGAALGFEREKAWRRHRITLRQLPGGVWVPETVDEVMPLDKMINRTRYRDVEVNVGHDDAVFRLDFPEVVRVREVRRGPPPPPASPVK